MRLMKRLPASAVAEGGRVRLVGCMLASTARSVHCHTGGTQECEVRRTCLGDVEVELVTVALCLGERVLALVAAGE